MGKKPDLLLQPFIRRQEIGIGIHRIGSDSAEMYLRKRYAVVIERIVSIYTFDDIDMTASLLIA